jgi:UrcA family protein
MPKLLCKGALVGAAALGLVLGGAAHAQNQGTTPAAAIQPPPADSMISGVTVSVPKIVETQRYGAVSQEISMSVRVPFGDLDMRSAEGVATLNKRVADAADYVCLQLERMYPVGAPERFYCVKEAVGDASPQVVRARAGG